MPSTLFLRIPLALAALASVVMVLRFPDERLPWWGITQNYIDVNVYRWGAHAVLHGQPLYDGLLTGDDSGRFYPQMAFTYPPFSALAFAPLDQVSPRLMEGAWMVFSLVLLYVAIRFSFRLVGYVSDPVTAQVSLCLAAVSLSLEPVRTTLWLGQINLVLLVLVLADEYASRRGWRIAGLGSGLAAGLKLTPAFFWAHWVVTRRWRMAIAGVAGFAATVAVGFAVIPSDARKYWSGTLFESERVGLDGMVANQSLSGIIARAAGLEETPTAVWLPLAVLVAVAGLGVAALVYRAGNGLLALVLSGMTTTMVSPFSWGHHWVWFVPLLVLAVHRAIEAMRGSGVRALAWWLVPVALWAAAANWTQSYPRPDMPAHLWFNMGLFMIGDVPELVLTLFRSVYPLVWLAVLCAAAVVAMRAWRARRAGRDGALVADARVG
ncbi:glycosyltransferase 87 family protein [Dietzia sp.]|uniref:glycosyltransferase 87 family protein n=1 Tax=Dietzia sp. TaxID=1871616 RepID=UPI002FDB31B0